MKVRSLLLLLFFFTPAIFWNCSQSSDGEITEDQVQELRIIADEFTKTIKTVLVKQMQNGGVPAALTVCSDTAQQLTADFASLKGINVKRVSFKNRNENDYPDPFEFEGLKYFEEMNEKGILKEGSEYVEIVTENNGEFIRYLKPIFVSDVCLNCHGDSNLFSPEVKALLNKNYPNDKAINYKNGELRGAVSIQKKLE